MQIPLTFRLIYYGLRAMLRAGLLFFCAWLIFIPATAEEARALGAPADTAFPLGMAQMRTARALLALAPERSYALLAFASGGELHPLMVKLVLTELASGRAVPGRASQSALPAPQTDRAITGPRFIKVD